MGQTNRMRHFHWDVATKEEEGVDGSDLDSIGEDSDADVDEIANGDEEAAVGSR